MKRKFVFCMLFYPAFFFSCKEEDLTGNATLVFSNCQDCEISIYPGDVSPEIPILIHVEPILRGLHPDIDGSLFIESLNTGNYLWYDGSCNKGYFQITAGKSREFLTSIGPC